LVYDLLFLVSILTVLQYANGTVVPADEQTQFVVDKLLYWVSLGITLAAAIGLGFQGMRYLRRKIGEDRAKDEKKLEDALGKHSEDMRRYVATIAGSARERRDKDEYMLQELIKRVDNLEEHQQMQLQIVLQNQQTITEFIKTQQQQQQQQQHQQHQAKQGSNISKRH
jgi:hypothetical protein